MLEVETAERKVPDRFSPASGEVENDDENLKAFKRPANGERNFVLTSASNFPIARVSAFPGDI